MMNFIDIIKMAIKRNASDIHLMAGERVRLRINTYLEELTDYPSITEAFMQKLFDELITSKNQLAIFDKHGAVDISYDLEELGFFRINFYLQSSKLALSLRVLPNHVPSFPSLCLPDVILNLIDHRSGIILITGATSNGKSTTLASLINEINLKQKKHIITIEDPIEYRYSKGKSLISQREVGRDCDGFATALRSVLRQDPDIILVGEMRDKETIETALTAADTGHLVLSTLHTNSASATIERILSHFEAHEHPLVASKLAGTLKGIIAQHLIPRLDGTGLVPAIELLLPVPSILSLIREGKSSQIYSAIQTGKSLGMITIDESLAHLVLTKQISKNEALARIQNKSVFESHLLTNKKINKK